MSHLDSVQFKGQALLFAKSEKRERPHFNLFLSMRHASESFNVKSYL